jgi:hypothetical protein
MDGPFRCTSNAGVVSVDFVRENLSVIFARQQDFERKGDAWFNFQAPISMRYQQRQELMPSLWCHFNCDDDRNPGHARCSFAAVRPSTILCLKKPETRQDTNESKEEKRCPAAPANE